jgi:antitoxin component of RelBE/YafQ-DinJ toxin-antitoxin module
MDFGDDERYAANSELRYITLELMKLAQKKNIPFDKISEEYVRNTFHLKNAIDNESPEKALKARKESTTP